MPEEAHERLVKLYLESKGFLVLTGYKINVEKNRTLEADLVAVRFKERDDGLPNRIIGEVKGPWVIKAAHFKELYEQMNLKGREEYKRFKIFYPQYREAVLSNVEGEYGKEFRFCIFALGIAKENSESIDEFLKKREIIFVPYHEVISGVIEYALGKSYSNDPELQVIRLMKKIKILK
jgi:hypothetical protein